MFDSQKFDPEMVSDISAKTGLNNQTVLELLENGWSYTEDNEEHSWSLAALKAQKIQMIAPGMTIPVPKVAPFGVPVSMDGVQMVWDWFVKRAQEKDELQSVEDRVLMAILRSMYAGFNPVDSGWKPELVDSTDTAPLTETPVDDACSCFGRCSLCVNGVGMSQAVHMDCPHCPVHANKS